MEPMKYQPSGMVSCKWFVIDHTPEDVGDSRDVNCVHSCLCELTQGYFEEINLASGKQT